MGTENFLLHFNITNYTFGHNNHHILDGRVIWTDQNCHNVPSNRTHNSRACVVAYTNRDTWKLKEEKEEKDTNIKQQQQ